MALAGTKRNKKSSLFADSKECFEHQLVVDGIKTSLCRLGSICVGPTYEWDSGLIQHLRTDMEIQISGDFDFNKLCEWMHPTLALGISSETLHWKWLKEIESPVVSRGRFGAPFGAILPGGQAKVVVAIRNVQWFGGKIYLGSGCGVVEQSQLHDEWEELFIKRKSVIHNLGME